MSTIFTKIINREIPAEIIWEDGGHVAFLSNFPTVPGHTLVVPRVEIDYIFDLAKDDYQNLMTAVYKLAPIIEAAMRPKRMAIAVVGVEIPHAHVHLVPLNTVRDIDFSLASAATPEELKAVGDKIRAELAQQK